MTSFNLTVFAAAAVLTAALFVGPAFAQGRPQAQEQTVQCVTSGHAETSCVVVFHRAGRAAR